MNFMYLCDASTEAATSAMKKIAEQSQAGAMIGLTSEEFEAVQGFKLINLDQESSSLVEVDVKKQYLLFADPNKVNIDDIEGLARGGLHIAVIRTNET